MFSKTQQMISPYSIYSMEEGYIFRVKPKKCTKKIVHQPGLRTLLRQIHPENYLQCWMETRDVFFASGFLARKQNMRLMSVSIEYQSPQDAFGSRQRKNHMFSTVIKGNRMCVCVFVKTEVCWLDSLNLMFVIKTYI